MIRKLQWAWRLLRAKYYVVLTDKESAIVIRGTSPGEFSSILALYAQIAALDEFSKQLKKLQKEHSKAVDKILGEGVTNSKQTKKPIRKIEVKEG